jgi:hypothetical protein
MAKWTPEQRAKFRATMKAKRKAQGDGVKRKYARRAAAPVSRDVLIYLTHAEKEIIRQLKEGRAKRISRQDLMVLLALSEIRGK